MSLKSRIENYYQKNYPAIIHKGTILKLAMEVGFESENAGRRCRELEDAGILKAFYQKGQVSYQWVPPGERIKTVLPPARVGQQAMI